MVTPFLQAAFYFIAALLQDRAIMRSRSSFWQHQLAAALSDPRALLLRLNLCENSVPDVALDDPFPMKVPLSFVARMKPQRPPRSSAFASTSASPGTSERPRLPKRPSPRDLQSPVKGMIHKYFNGC